MQLFAMRTFEGVQGRHKETVFVTVPADQPFLSCLRMCAPPVQCKLKEGAHLRNVSTQCLASIVRNFCTAAAQRNTLEAWVHAVTHTAGRSTAQYPLPNELLMQGLINPTIAALVVAIAQQLDVVDAAVHDLQVCLPLHPSLAAKSCCKSV
jgi:hypothetical protein